VSWGGECREELKLRNIFALRLKLGEKMDDDDSVFKFISSRDCLVQWVARSRGPEVSAQLMSV
jgi:hypothetical protein